MILKLVNHVQKRRGQLLRIRSVNFCDKKSTDDGHKSDKQQKNDKKKNEEENESAAERLNKLLASMKKDEYLMVDKTVGKIPKAGGRKIVKDKIKQEQIQKQQKIEMIQKSQDIVQAAKDVASLMGEDKKKTESELLMKLLNHDNDDIAVSDVTSESDVQSDKKLDDLSLNDLISRMKIDRHKDETQKSRADYVRNIMSARDKRQTDKRRRFDYREGLSNAYKKDVSGSVNLFNGEKPLGIFTNDPIDTLEDNSDSLRIWKKLEEKELKMAITHPPKNYFEKMILWTEQGKLWKFPIDNEQGLDDEKRIDFSEHVFLEQHLETWCPTKGPIRHFMELVCVGLSKNPYLTAQEKKEHILWYKDYFEQKKDILKDVILSSKENSKEQKAVEST